MKKVYELLQDAFVVLRFEDGKMINGHKSSLDIIEGAADILDIIDESTTVLSHSKNFLSVSSNIFIKISRSNVEKLLETTFSNEEWTNFIDTFDNEITVSTRNGRTEGLSEAMTEMEKIGQRLVDLADEKIIESGVTESEIEEANYGNINTFFTSKCDQFVVIEVAYQIGYSLKRKKVSSGKRNLLRLSELPILNTMAKTSN